MAPPKVVHLSFHLDVRRREPKELLTAWPTLVETAAAVARTDASVTVVQACHLDTTIVERDVDFHFVRGAPPFAKLSLTRRLIECVRLLRPDVVQVAGLGSPLQTRALSRALSSIPVVVQDHAGVPVSGIRKSVHRWGLARVDAALFTAREQAEAYFSAGILRADMPVFEVLEGSSCFTPGDQPEARRRTGLAGDPCVLWLARLDANKDPLSVLEAVRTAVEKLPGMQLWCCFSGGELERDVRAMIAADDLLRKIVQLVGKRPHGEVEMLCRAADFLVQGSWREGSGFAVIEALACGLPPIVTDIPSFRKITRNGAVGALSPAGNSAAMARNLIDLAKRNRSELRAAARRQFEQELSYAAIGCDLRHAYDQVLAAK